MVRIVGAIVARFDVLSQLLPRFAICFRSARTVRDLTTPLRAFANAVAPGAAKTEIIVKGLTQGVYDEASVSAMHSMNRMGVAQEIVNGIVWLLSDEASFVTGHILNIDGGFQAMTNIRPPNH